MRRDNISNAKDQLTKMRRRKESKGNAESLRADLLLAVAELASYRVELGWLRVLVWRSEATPLV